MSNFKNICPWCGKALTDRLEELPTREQQAGKPFLYKDYVVKDNRLLGYYGEPRERVLLLPDVAESITQYAIISDMHRLHTIIVPEGVKTIEDECFMHCSNLSTITLPNGLGTIGARAFSRCYNLEELSIPENVTSVGEEFIGSCEKLESIELPPSVKISNWVFKKALVKNVILTKNQMDDAIEEALKYYTVGDEPKKTTKKTSDEVSIDDVFAELLGTDKLARAPFCPFGMSKIERVIVGGMVFTVDDVVEKLIKRGIPKKDVFYIISEMFILTPMLEKSKFYQLQKEIRAEELKL